MIMIMIMIMIEIQGKGTACKPDRYIIRSNKMYHYSYQPILVVSKPAACMVCPMHVILTV